MRLHTWCAYTRSMHTWMSTDTIEHVDCVYCGGTWAVDADDQPAAANGDRASACTGPYTRHGDPREHGDDDNVRHYSSDCNCLFCA